MESSAVLVTGIQGAGKSTVGRMLAEWFEYGAFVEGDQMWKLIVSGRIDMTPDPDPEALRQLELRFKNGAMLVDSLVEAGFTAVHADLIFEGFLYQYVSWLRTRPVRVVVLAPSMEAVMERERGRGGDAYRAWVEQGGSLEAALQTFQTSLNLTPRVGLWIDSTSQTPEETVNEILSRWDEALVEV